MLGDLGVGYTEALRAAYADVPETVDFVLYWWHRAAEEVRSGRARRFGLITTNSLRQVRQRSVLARHLNAAEHPLKLVWAIPDHPWHGEGADVRIAMTVGGLKGSAELAKVISEVKAPDPEHAAEGLVIEERPVDAIHEDLSAGANVTEALALKANDGMSCRGMELGGSGFMVSPEQWKGWKQPTVVHPYRNGRDLMDHPRGAMVIDCYGLQEEELRKRFPQVYQHLLQTVKPERVVNNAPATRDNWWIFRRPHPEFRPALNGLPRYIATVETAKHRVFQFLEGSTVPDNMIVVIASDRAFHLGVLNSRIHAAWALAAGALLGVGNTPRYSKSRCFDPFPFPEVTKAQAKTIGDLAEEIDAHRKRAQAAGYGLTKQYNLLEILRAGHPLPEKAQAQDAEALVSLLLELHQRLDAAVAAAYGWPTELPDDEILARLVALNQARAEEEARGIVRWLRPEHQAKA